MQQLSSLSPPLGLSIHREFLPRVNGGDGGDDNDDDNDDDYRIRMRR